jgi:DNA-binding CsgD family transcriptional regulator/tetratricopeptide (TPR) repeat protein
MVDSESEPTGAKEGAAVSSTVVSPVLVGRAAEFGELRDAYERARQGRSVTVLVAGEAGIGKSRLVSAALADLPGDPLVLSGGCLEVGSDSAPYVPFVAILRDLVAQLGPDRVDELLPLAGSALARWLPGLDTAPEGTADGRTRLLEEMLTLLWHVSRTRPVALTVEDLHWADASSRELFVYLARNLGDHAVLLIGTVRSGELAAGHPARTLLTELGRRAEVVQLDLRPLKRTDVATLVTAIAGERPDPARASRIHRRSGGNPLFIEALSSSEDISRNLNALLLDRIAELPAALRRLLSIAAVAGANASDDLVRAVSDLPEDDLHEALRELVERDHLVVRADGYAIRHDLIREAIYRSLLPGDRRRLHLRCAKALAAESEASAALVEHWFAAGERERALPAAWRAAASAASQYAYDEQLHLLERVLDLWDQVQDAAALVGVSRVTVLEHAAAAGYATGQSSAGVGHCTAALAEFDLAADPIRAARLLTLRGRMRARIQGDDQGDLAEAVALVPPGADDAEAERTRGDALAALAFVGVSDIGVPAPQYAAEALRIGDRLRDDGLRASALVVLGRVRYVSGDHEGASELFADGRRAAEAVGDHQMYLTLLQWEAASLMVAGYFREMAALALVGQQAAERFGMTRSRGSMLAVNRGIALTELGRWDEALQVVGDALADAPPPYYEAMLEWVGASIAVDRGDAEHAVRRLEDYVERNPAASEIVFSVLALVVKWSLVRGDLDRADRVLGRAITGLAVSRGLDFELMVVALTGVRVQLARKASSPRSRQVADAVEARLRELRTLADQVSGHGPALVAFRLTFDALVGRATLPDWDRAVEAWRVVGSAYELALALVAAAETALSGSNRSGAQTRLREARAIARDLRAEPLLHKIDSLAVRARLDETPDEPAADPLGLTRREVEVLRVLATGKSNAEIATELFVSTNTVASHIRSILLKLGVSTRTEAAALAHRSKVLG